MTMTAHNQNLVLIPHTANDWIDPRVVLSVRRMCMSDAAVGPNTKVWVVSVFIDGRTQPRQAGLQHLYYFDTAEQADDAIAAIVGQND